MIKINKLSYIYKRKLFHKIKENSQELDIYIEKLEIKKGERVALVGTNGSGKSTLIKMLIGILKPYDGELLINQKIPYKDRISHVNNLGVVWGNRSTLWWDLTAIENFELLKSIYKIEKEKFNSNIKLFANMFECEGILDRQIRKLSLGQRMKIEIISALLHSPKILVFDEPFLGLDFISKEKILIAINQYLDTNNATLVLTSHDLNDISTLCKEMILLDKGRLIIKDNTEKLIKDNLRSYEILIEQEKNLDFSNIQDWIDSSMINIIGRSGLKGFKLNVDYAIKPVEILGRIMEDNKDIENFFIVQNDLENLIRNLAKEVNQREN